MGYRTSYDGKEYEVNVIFYRGYKGDSTSPPEDPSIEITEVYDEYGNPVSDELFELIEDHCYNDVRDQVVEEYQARKDLRR